MFNRRQVLQAAAATAAASLAPTNSYAADPLVVATFPGTWNEAHRNVLTPYFKNRTRAEVTQTVLLATDQVSRMQAARGKAPFDVSIMDEGPLVDAVAAGVLEKYPADKSPNYADLLPQFKNEWGPTISIQVIGIGYNPKKIKQPPKSWDALWDPPYKGRVGLTALNSTLGLAFLVELARLKGGSETNADPAFAAIRQLLPNVGAVAANLGAFAPSGSRNRSTSRPTTSISCRHSKTRVSMSSSLFQTAAGSPGAPACIWSKVRSSPISPCSTSTRIWRPRSSAIWNTGPITSSRPTAR